MVLRESFALCSACVLCSVLCSVIGVVFCGCDLCSVFCASREVQNGIIEHQARYSVCVCESETRGVEGSRERGRKYLMFWIL